MIAKNHLFNSYRMLVEVRVASPKDLYVVLK